MKKFILLMIVFAMLSSSALALYAWETGKLPYKPSMSGSVCWTTTRMYKEGNKKEPIFHSMDLSTGEISTKLLGNWYLIHTDHSQNGTLIALQEGGKLKIAQYDRDGGWNPFLEYPFEHSFSEWIPAIGGYNERSVVAYQSGMLYYMISEGEKSWLRRDDMKGNVYDYQYGSSGALVSPSGNVFGYSSEGEKCIEVPNGAVYDLNIEERENIILLPCAWLDDDRLLVWVRKRGKDRSTMIREQSLQVYAFRKETLQPVLSDTGAPILYTTGADGFSHALSPSGDRTAQLCFWGEDYFSVPTILNLTMGEPTFIAETEHTDTYDEYCTSHDRIMWLIPG